MKCLTPGLLLRLLSSIMLISVSSTGMAYSFNATESEWITWPGYCKARHAEMSYGRQIHLTKTVSNSSRAEWSKKLGKAYTPIHHYCAGLAYMQRYHATADKATQALNLKEALGEFLYTFNRVPTESHLYPEVAINYGLALHKDGQEQQALEILKTAISAQPSNARAYAAVSIVYGNLNDTSNQRKILERGIEATNGESAELHYFLGLNLVKQKNYEQAREHAIKAYSLGYPLPGLKRRLKRAGYSLQN